MRVKSKDPNTELDPLLDDFLEPYTELGREFKRQLQMAISNRNSTRIGDYSVTELLHKCRDASDDRTSPQEYEFRSKYPAWSALPVSLVRFKTGILIALLRETLVDVADAPFIIDPTPKPQIPEEQMQELVMKSESAILEMAKQTIAAGEQYVQLQQQQGLPVDYSNMPSLDPKIITEMLKQQKIKLYQDVKKHATEQAMLLQRELYDKTTEGGYRRAIMEFSDDFAIYPYACIHGPTLTVKNEAVWKDNKFVEERSEVWSFERISPFDVFWTPDCHTTQTGTAIFIRKQVGYNYLYDCLALADSNKGYIASAIEELIQNIKDGAMPRNWVDFVAPNPEDGTNRLMWNRGETSDIIIRYGQFLGYDLQEMGFTDLDEDKVYETKTIMCGGQIIYCAINENPSQYKRPVFITSFEKRNGSLYGVGLAQKILGIHEAFRSIINLAMYNVGLASEPITEVEFNRISQYVPDDWVDNPVIGPGMVFPADGDRMGNGSRAIKFTQIPTTTDSLLRLASYIMELCHTVSNIPAALHGQPVGSGANRTVRGLLTLQGNTLKPIHSGLMNLDIDIIQSMITLLYMLLVKHEPDFKYTGDSKVIAKGAASMIEREMEKQAAMENLQILGQLGQQINPEILNRTVLKLLQTAGIVEPGENVIMELPQQQLQQTPQPQEQAPPVQ